MRTTNPILLLLSLICGVVASSSAAERVEQQAPVAASNPVALPMPDKAAIRQLLLTHQYELLESVLEQYRLDSMHDLATTEEPLIQAYRSFTVKPTDLLPRLDAWVEQRPAAYQAYAARATARIAAGIDARGTKYAKETKPEQFDLMNRYLRQGVEDARASLKLQPRNLQPYREMVIAAGVEGSDAVVKPATEALTAFPASYRIRASVLSKLQPRWGGSYQAMEALAAAAQEYVADNARLLALRGYADWARGRDMSTAKRHEEALEYFNKALSYGESDDFLQDRNFENRQLHRYEDAFADARRYDAQDADRGEGKTLVEKTADDAWRFAAKLYEDGSLEQAAGIYGLLIKQQQNVTQATSWRGYCNCQLHKPDFGLDDLSQAATLDPNSAVATQLLVECLQLAGKTTEAADAQKMFAEHSPSGEAYRRLSLLYQAAGNAEEWKAATIKACELGADRSCTFIRPTADQYYGVINDLIEIYLRYPEKAVSSKQAGVANIRVTFDRTGALLSKKVVKSSGIPALDAAGLDVFKRLGRFPPVPDSFTPDQKTFSVIAPINFRLSN